MNYVFKGSLKIEGISFLELLVKNLSPLFGETILVGSQQELESFQSDRQLALAPDRYSGIGPFAGILTAFELTGTDEIFVCPCDSPFLSAAAVRELEEARGGFDVEIAIPISENRFYPLIGFYNRSVVPHIHHLIEQGQNAIRFLFRQCPTLMVHFRDPAPFLNINTWREYETLLRESRSFSKESWRNAETTG